MSNYVDNKNISNDNNKAKSNCFNQRPFFANIKSLCHISMIALSITSKNYYSTD